MKPSRSNLAQIVGGNHAISVPLYQRKYEWEKERIVAFWNDLARLVDNGAEESLHYMGTMVRQEEAPGDNGLQQFMVIDGQQRITSLMLLMYALKKFLEDVRFQNDREAEAVIQERLLAYALDQNNDRLHISSLLADKYFITRLEGAGHVRRFMPTEFDRDSYYGLIYNGSPLRRRLHYKNAMVFYRSIEVMAEVETTKAGKVRLVHRIFDALRRMNFVYVCLDVHDNPQQIFESINYRGKPLSATDLIRNHVIRIADGEDARRQVYDRVWRGIQSELQRNEEEESPALFEEFFRAYVAMSGGVVADGEIYSRLTNMYPRIAGEATPELVSRLSPIKDYARIYRKLAAPSKEDLDTPLGRAAQQFARIGFITPMSLLMRFYRPGDPHPEDIHVINALAVLESFFVRRSLLGKPVKGMSDLFADITKKYDVLVRTGDQVPDHEFSDWLKDQLTEMTTVRGGYPSLKPVERLELIEEASRAEVYLNSRTITKYVLGEYERHLSGEEMVDVESCEVEHVLPQEVTEWKPDILSWNLNENGESQEWSVHEDKVDLLVHTIGNLTLISPGGNKHLKNYPYIRKKAVLKYGYDRSNFKMTLESFGPTSHNWTFKQIEERSEKLFEFIDRRFNYMPHWR